jgi:hypothetical protein
MALEDNMPPLFDLESSGLQAFVVKHRRSDMTYMFLTLHGKLDRSPTCAE